MAVVAVTFDGTRFHTADSYTNWGNYGGSGAGGSNEAPLAYQNSLASNRKQTTTGGTLGGIDYDPGAGALDHTAAANRLVFIKAYVSDAFDLNTSEGLRITVGSASTATYKYNFAGSTATNDAHLAYPAQGGYVLAPIDVTVAFWPITTTGTFDDTAVDYYGIQGSWITGTAKAENIAMDAIDVGTGLYLVGGTGADPQASFVTYVEKDQNINTNRWGCVSGAGANVSAWCVLRAGGAIEFNDTTSIVSFKDGYHGAGLTGVLHELDTAASTFDVGSTIIGEGKLYNSGAIDTRPDYVVTGTTMTATYNFSGNLRNFRNITFNSKVDCDGGDIECQLLTQDTAEIQNSIVRCNALTSVAVLQDPTFGDTTGLHDTTFIQNGAGHAIEIDTAGDYTLTNIFFVDGTSTWGATTSASAMLDVTAGSGTVNILVDGGTSAVTYITAGATVNILASIPVVISGATEGSAVKIISRETLGSVTIGDTLSEGFVPDSGIYTYSHNDEGSLDITVRVRNQGIVTAAIADDGGVFTDETEETSSNSTADMTLLPTTPVADDAYYFGHDEQFPRMKLVVSTAMVHSAAVIAVEYYNGSSWSAVDRGSLEPANDFFDSTGEHIIDWVMPDNWATTTINSQGPFYYIRLRLDSFTSITTAPIGSNANLDVSRYLPYVADREIITGTGLSDVVSWREDTIAQLSPDPLPVESPPPPPGSSNVLDVGHAQAASAGTTISDSFTLPAGNDRKMVVWGYHGDDLIHTMTATYDSNSMTQIDSVVGSSIHRMTMFWYDIPDGHSGSKTVQINYSVSSASREVSWAIINDCVAGAEEDFESTASISTLTSITTTCTNTTADAVQIHALNITGGTDFDVGTDDVEEYDAVGVNTRIHIVSELVTSTGAQVTESNWTTSSVSQRIQGAIFGKNTVA